MPEVNWGMVLDNEQEAMADDFRSMGEFIDLFTEYGAEVAYEVTNDYVGVQGDLGLEDAIHLCRTAVNGLRVYPQIVLCCEACAAYCRDQGLPPKWTSGYERRNKHVRMP